MGYAFIMASVLTVSIAAMAPSAAASCAHICNQSAHSRVQVINGGQTGFVHNGVRVIKPAPVYNVQQQADFAAGLRRADARVAARENRRLAARLTDARNAETAARLSAIEAKQDLILERQKRAAQPRRRVFYGNNRFFGRNGFIGNSNFSGATVPAKRGFKRKKQRGY